jgi:hypothetical protein
MCVKTHGSEVADVLAEVIGLGKRHHLRERITRAPSLKQQSVLRIINNPYQPSLALQSKACHMLVV